MLAAARAPEETTPGFGSILSPSRSMSSRELTAGVCIHTATASLTRGAVQMAATAASKARTETAAARATRL